MTTDTDITLDGKTPIERFDQFFTLFKRDFEEFLKANDKVNVTIITTGIGTDDHHDLGVMVINTVNDDGMVLEQLRLAAITIMNKRTQTDE